MSIRLGRRFGSCCLAEINTHSLFSKWFSESGKLVGKIFKKIRDSVEDETMLCFVLIDEVESLAAARRSALAGSEPSDALRVVNALLTQLDSLRRFPNIFIMATSNITEAIDVAFIDRADLKVHVGLPPVGARYAILRGALQELVRKGLVRDAGPSGGDSEDAMVDTPEATLTAVAQQCDGMSGRMLRKLPFLAFSTMPQIRAQACAMGEYLQALLDTVRKEKARVEALDPK